MHGHADVTVAAVELTWSTSRPHIPPIRQAFIVPLRLCSCRGVIASLALSCALAPRDNPARSLFRCSRRSPDKDLAVPSRCFATHTLWASLVLAPASLTQPWPSGRSLKVFPYLPCGRWNRRFASQFMQFFMPRLDSVCQWQGRGAS